MKLINESTKVTDEQVKQLEKQLNEIGSPKIVRRIGMRKGEEDIRQLPSADKSQLTYRLMCDYWQYLSAMQTTLNDMLIVMMAMAQKQGIDVAGLIDNVDKGG